LDTLRSIAVRTVKLIRFATRFSAALLLATAPVTAVSARRSDHHTGVRIAQWGMFKHGLSRTARTHTVGPQTNNLQWSHVLKGGGMQGALAIGADGTIYGGSVQGVFYAFRQNGAIRWRHKLARYEITAGPAIGSDGTIYIMPENSDLYAFNPDGSTKWVFDLSGYGGPSSSPAIAKDGTIYVGSDQLYAIDSGGKLRWTYSTGSYINGPPAISRNGTLYFPSGGFLYSVRPDGTLKWKAAHRSEYPLGSAPAIAPDGTIYANTHDGVLHAFRPDGSLKWTFETPGIVVDVPSSPAIGGDGTVYFGGAGEYEGRGGYFYAVNPDGSQKWKYFAGCDQTAPAIGGDGTIYFGGDYCITVMTALAPDGTQKWSYGSSIVYLRSAPTIGRNGRLYIGALAGPLFPDTGGLFAFGP
jgi:outer membrane protein assembly factor BamB